MWDVIANEIAGWFLAAFGVKKGSERERLKRQHKAKKKPPFARRHRK